MIKIGYPVNSFCQEEQIRVTFMGNKSCYDDTKYPGHGLIDLEDLINASPEYSSFQE